MERGGIESEYTGIEFDEDEDLWFAFGDIGGDLDALQMGWALSAEDAAWIREAAIVMQHDRPFEAPERNFPDVDHETVRQHFIAAHDRFEAWLEEEQLERPAPPILFAFQFDEAERDLEGGALEAEPLTAALVRGVKSGALTPAASTAHDYLLTLSDELLEHFHATLYLNFDPDDEGKDGEDEEVEDFDIPRLVVGLAWLEGAMGDGLRARRIDELLSFLAGLVDIERKRRAGEVEMTAPGRITGDPDAIIARRVADDENLTLNSDDDDSSEQVH
jgi:hypothetical protein